MKKFESLKSSKFEAFKSNVLNSPLAISGGLISHTTWYELGNPSNRGEDTWKTGNDTKSYEDFIFNERGDMTWAISAPPGDIFNPDRYSINMG